MKNKVEGWVKDLQLLSNYTQDVPQAAHSAFTKGLCFRWSHFKRTVLDATNLSEPLGNAIRDQLIPALIGLEISDAERQILELFLSGMVGKVWQILRNLPRQNMRTPF